MSLRLHIYQVRYSESMDNVLPDRLAFDTFTDFIYEDLYDAIDRAHLLLLLHENAKQAWVMSYITNITCPPIEIYRCDIYSFDILRYIRMLPVKQHETVGR